MAQNDNDKKQDKATDDSNANQKDNKQEKKQNEKSDEQKQRELDELLKQLKELQQQKNNLQQKQSPKPKVLMVEFGARFHPNGLINYTMYYLLNLVIIYSFSEIYEFFSFSGSLIDLLLFIGVYTLIEIIFRTYIVTHHFKFVLRTFGFVFFLGYLTIFFFLEQYLFSGLFGFTNENLFVIFIASLVLIRYIISHLMRHTISKYMRW